MRPEVRAITRRRLIGAALLLPLLGAIGGCAGLGGPRVVTLDEAELAALVEKQFPFDRRLLEIVDLRVSAPSLRLVPERNRLASELQLRLSDRLYGQALEGRVALDYALRWDAAAQALRLADVRVGTVELGGATGTLGAAARGLGPLLAEQLLADAVIWRPRPEDLADRLGGRWQPGAVDVTRRGVEIRLDPVR